MICRTSILIVILVFIAASTTSYVKIPPPTRPVIQDYKGTRITVHTPLNFTTVINKLYGSVGTPTNLQFPAIGRNITGYDEANKEEFIAAINEAVGPQGFMLFQEYNHGFWLPLFGLSRNLGLKRLILGNPLIALTMLQYDLTAGLAVPPELLVREKPVGEGCGTELIYQLPSALIAGLNRDPRLLKAARELDQKFAALVQFVVN